MKTQAPTIDTDDMRPEYDPELIRRGVRGKFYDRYHSHLNGQTATTMGSDESSHRDDKGKASADEDRGLDR
jgi:hypothetical protein